MFREQYASWDCEIVGRHISSLAFPYSPSHSSRPEIYLQTASNSCSLQSSLSRLALSDKYSQEEDIYQILEHSFERILGYEEHFDITEGLNPTNLYFCRTLLNIVLNPRRKNHLLLPIQRIVTYHCSIHFSLKSYLNLSQPLHL